MVSSPLVLSGDAVADPMPTAMKAAITQLHAWCDAFWRCASRIVVSYIIADAIMLCHILKHHQSHPMTDTKSWYRHPHTCAALGLDCPDYDQDSHAPTIFNSIDSSSLLHHLGALDVLTACSPLLEQLPYSTIRTELNVPGLASIDESARTVLCGDLPTFALLLGIKPIQYWTSTSSTYHADAWNLQDSPDRDGVNVPPNVPAVLWKPVDLTLIKYGPTN
jgi:hypothetical protein